VNLTVWALEWRLALARPRFFVLGLLLPLSLVLPVATGAAPVDRAAGAYTMLFVALTVLGSALPLRWDGQRGMARRLVRGGMRPWSYLLQRAGAGATRDFVQLVPALLVICLAGDGTWLDGFGLAGLVLATVWIAALLGVLSAAFSRSLPEAALVGGLVVILLGHLSGVFWAPAEGSLGALLETVAPFRALHEFMVGLAMDRPRAGGRALLLWAVLLPALVSMLGGRLHSALCRRESGGLEGV
jgi:hypothetical protein